VNDTTGKPAHLPRYVVLVWMYDHWGVTYATDDKAEAEAVKASAETKVPCAFVADTINAEGRGIECEDWQAQWCPIHGTCTCPHRPDGEVMHNEGPERCPLHADDSDHPTWLVEA